MGKELLILYNLSLVDQECGSKWCRATSEYWNLAFLGNRCCIFLPWELKGPNLGFLACVSIHAPLFMSHFKVFHN